MAIIKAFLLAGGPRDAYAWPNEHAPKIHAASSRQTNITAHPGKIVRHGHDRFSYRRRLAWGREVTSLFSGEPYRPVSFRSGYSFAFVGGLSARLFAWLDATAFDSTEDRFLFPVLPIWTVVLLLTIAQAVDATRSGSSMREQAPESAAAKCELFFCRPSSANGSRRKLRCWMMRM
jgi:hypothetical protein